MLGMRFDQCQTLLLSFTFESCQLDFSSFYKLKIKGTLFKNCSLHEVEFREADLTHVCFENCDLTRSVFENTNLTGADLRSAIHFAIDPEQNTVKKMKVALGGLPGLLEKHNLLIG